ncbi:MAG: hypothetical protein ACRDOK_10100 [Streptosporangiaceae bacterium]
MPLVSIAAGIAVLGERLTWYEPVGAAIIVAAARHRGWRARWAASRL